MPSPPWLSGTHPKRLAAHIESETAHRHPVRQYNARSAVPFGFFLLPSSSSLTPPPLPPSTIYLYTIKMRRATLTTFLLAAVLQATAQVSDPAQAAAIVAQLEDAPTSAARFNLLNGRDVRSC